jgi:hypothetical protein
MNTIITPEYAQSLSSLKLGSIVRNADNSRHATSSMLHNVIAELKARNSYDYERNRKQPS